MKPEDWVKFRKLFENANIGELIHMKELVNNEIKWATEEEELIGVHN